MLLWGVIVNQSGRVQPGVIKFTIYRLRPVLCSALCSLCRLWWSLGVVIWESLCLKKKKEENITLPPTSVN